jgi:hypothetical protein
MDLGERVGEAVQVMHTIHEWLSFFQDMVTLTLPRRDDLLHRLGPRGVTVDARLGSLRIKKIGARRQTL